MNKKALRLEKRRREVLEAYAQGEGITSIMLRMCKRYDIQPQSFWKDWALIRPDRKQSTQSTASPSPSAGTQSAEAESRAVITP